MILVVLWCASAGWSEPENSCTERAPWRAHKYGLVKGKNFNIIVLLLYRYFVFLAVESKKGNISSVCLFNSLYVQQVQSKISSVQAREADHNLTFHLKFSLVRDYDQVAYQATPVLLEEG